MANTPTCKQCRHKTSDHYCTHIKTLDKDGKSCLARLVWYVSYNDRGDYCAGKFFESKEGAMESNDKPIREIAKELKAGGMRCNCDLDNWQPEPMSGHSCVCRIHKTAMEMEFFPKPKQAA